jgi:NAD(P)-dependent dehydrogenase (short-subunit alcohol dehydrogenase family)
MPAPILDYSGKTVVITGATGAIGLALCRGFAEAGARVIGAGATAAEVEACGKVEGVDFTALDVRSDEDIARFTAGIEAVDVLLNGAGVNLRAAEHTPEGFLTTVDINLNGTMRLSYALHDKLATRQGAVLNVCSMYSFFGAPHAPAYSASKGAVAQLTKSLAIAWAKDGIRVNAIAPGWIESAMTAVPRANPTRNAELMARFPTGRWGTPEDLVGPALFMCSPLAGFVTGTILPVDGGYLVA